MRPPDRRESGRPRSNSRQNRTTVRAGLSTRRSSGPNKAVISDAMSISSLSMALRKASTASVSPSMIRSREKNRASPSKAPCTRPSSAASGPAIRASQGEASPLRTTSSRGSPEFGREPESDGQIGRVDQKNLVRLIAESLEQRWMASPETSRQLRAGERQGRQRQDAQQAGSSGGKMGNRDVFDHES